MKFWLEEKRGKYINRLLQMKEHHIGSGYPGGFAPPSCPRCHVGQAVWRCLDCTDKMPVCMLCCRSAHKFNILHRIEKWNGRFYQHGALWQVGVKIYTGHNGAPCPRSTAALADIRHPFAYSQHPINVDLPAVAKQFSLTETELLLLISDSLEHSIGTLTQSQRDILVALAERSQENVLDLLSRLKTAVSSGAETSAATLQAEADRCSAEYENGVPESHPHDIPIDVVAGEDLADNDWVDEDDRPAKGHLPRFLPRPPPSDGAGNTFMTVVHTNGFHSLPVVWCACPIHSDDRDLQLLDLHLYPATYDNIKTAFTFSCLNDHRYESLECKSSHYQYHNKLRRLTCPSYPEAAPNRYAELRRVSRQWRNLKYRRWFWQLNDLNVKRGQMALFCAACPQPGINLPEGSRANHEQNPSLYMRSFVADGNFKANHLKQKNDNTEVWLTSGEGFMTNEDRYNMHLAQAQETKVTPTCHHHRAQLNGEVPHSSSDCSGVGGHACARHGCFAPGSLVNFQKGEQQMNMDWSLCEAIATTNIGWIQFILHIYDISCQYCRHLETRIARNDLLSIPHHIQLLHAIGLFHVHGHKDDCLYRWATSYVPGAGVIDGEVLETLWSVLNTVSAATRTASLAHRTEILDDHMSDNNWKKMLNIVRLVISRYNRVLENIVDARLAFHRLNDTAPPASVDEWETSIREAEAARSEDTSSMDIMHSQIKTGQSLKEITAEIMREDGLSQAAVPDDGSSTEWLLEGFRIEDEQIRIRQLVRSAGRSPTADETQAIESKRQRIAARIRDFHITATRLLGASSVSLVVGSPDQLDDDGYVSDNVCLPEERGIVANLTKVENTLLAFPATISGNLSLLSLDLRSRECRLRRAKANDTLSHVRQTLSGLSYQYINKVRQSVTSREHLKSYDGIKLLSKEVSFYQQVYNRNSRTLGKVDPAMKQRYPTLRRSECTISKVIADVNARGESQARLPWFWAAVDGWDNQESAAQHDMLDNDRLLEFYRVNWMRARAQRHRWEEELARTEHEMQWTTLYFMHQRDLWYSRLIALRQTPGASPGHNAFCQENMYQWEEFARIAEFQFRRVNPTFPETWRPLITVM